MSDDDDEIPAGPISLEGLAQIRRIDPLLIPAFVGDLRRVYREIQHFIWLLERHAHQWLDPTAEDLADELRGIVDKLHEIHATFRREMGK